MGTKIKLEVTCCFWTRSPVACRHKDGGGHINTEDATTTQKRQKRPRLYRFISAPLCHGHRSYLNANDTRTEPMGSARDRGQTAALGARLPRARTSRRHPVHTLHTRTSTATLAPQYVPRVLRVCALALFRFLLRLYKHTHTHTHIPTFTYVLIHTSTLSWSD